MNTAVLSMPWESQVRILTFYYCSNVTNHKILSLCQNFAIRPSSGVHVTNESRTFSSMYLLQTVGTSTTVENLTCH